MTQVLSPKAVIIVLAIAATGYLAVVPLGYLLWETFVSESGSLTLEHVRAAYSSQNGLLALSVNTLLFTFGSAAVAIPLGTTLASLNVRTDVPGRRVVFVASLVPLIIPGILHTIAWIFLASPRIGILNQAIEPVVGPAFFDVFSLPGMALVEGLHVSPLVFLLMVAAFRSTDPSLEESALLSGASRLRVVRSITLPSVRPALLAATLIVAVNGMASFEVPALLGIPGGIWVYTSRIWRVLTTFPADYGQAGAYALALLAITSVGIYLQSRLGRRGQAFQTVSGRGFRPGGLPLGRWRWAATAFVAGYFVVAVVLPLFVLLYMSTQNFYRPPSAEAFRAMTLDNYRDVVGHSQVGRALKNSLLLAIGSATTVMITMSIVSWIVVRTRARGRWALDNLTFLPMVVPGLVMGVSLLFVYLRSPIPIYGTLWILFIAYLTRYMPYGMRYAATSMHQIADELEESAAVSGATWWQQFRRVTLPLVMPGLVSGWIYIVIVSVRELSSSILLYSPGNEVLSIIIWEQWEGGQTNELAALGVMMIGGLIVLVAVGSKLGARLGLAAP
jgi:iron(III) transport system permease protein